MGKLLLILSIVFSALNMKTKDHQSLENLLAKKTGKIAKSFFGRIKYFGFICAILNSEF